jgi:competence protein ComEC
VGHGNCAILRDNQAVSVIDCGYDGSILLHTLKRLKIKAVDHVLISHADIDHVGGLAYLIEALPVHNIYMNPDASKMGKMWERNLRTLEAAEHLGTQVHIGLTSSSSQKIISGEVTIEILAPSASLAASGAGGTYLAGQSLNSNTMSVVIGLIHKSCRVVLLPGDMNEFGLNNLLKRYNNIEAQILIFPHHGGYSGSTNDQEFARKLCTLVKPKLVLFSLDRSRYDNPKEEIVRGAVTALPHTHIMCTQLSGKCSTVPFPPNFGHLVNLPAQGIANNTCCGGTVRIKIDGEQTTYDPSPSLHREFVKSLSERLTKDASIQKQDEGIQQSSEMLSGPLCLRYHTYCPN